MHEIHRIELQGNPLDRSWLNVIQVRIEFQDADGQWGDARTKNVFPANVEDEDGDRPRFDPEDTERLSFSTPAIARAVRIYPISHNGEQPSLRLEIYGKLLGKNDLQHYISPSVLLGKFFQAQTSSSP